MENILDRFIRYAKIDTQSNEEITDRIPTTEKQWELARMLQEELNQLGMSDVLLNQQCFLTATLPANTEKDIPTIGFLAHIDTSQDFTADGVKPQIIKNYNGEDIPLKGKKGMLLSPQEFPELLEHIGETIVTTDGTTLLGADDKAGIAVIMNALEYLINNPDVRHGTIKIAFTPDEETGMGIGNFEVEAFDADFAYTIDGGKCGEIEFENFNAAKALVTVNGKSVHPGSAKNVMKNAIHILYEFNALLPANDRPEHTEGREGFFHLIRTYPGSVETIKAGYLIRDHDTQKFMERKALMRDCVDFINSKYGAGTVVAEITDQYRNMYEVITPVIHIVETAKQAMHSLGIKPIVQPIRGGTDGARLSYMGLPTPNLFNGGHNFHGPYEFLVLETMEKAVQVILKIIDLYAHK